MEEKSFLFTPELTKKMLKLRFQNDWLFKKQKQPWREFRKLLLEHGFPEEMTVDQIRKKWSYQWDLYKIAKRTKNKHWKYYSMFDKHFGGIKVLDKYESWSDKWRLKLIICISEAKDLKTDLQLKTVERAMRSRDLPIDCCIQDLRGLWHHLKVIFDRKHRIVVKRGLKGMNWPLYEPMLEYFKQNNPSHLSNIDTNSAISSDNAKVVDCKTASEKTAGDSDEFNWSKNITESFIQLRLQHDWQFKEKCWSWNNFNTIMVKEYGFPKILTGRHLSKKWASIYRDYQKAKAKKNTSWLYYSLFELYMGEEKLNLNPLSGWSEEWIFNLISARTDLDHVFKFAKNHISGWREVEKRLRTIGLPLDHTLLDLTEKWTHLQKTYAWKQKFANKGILNEQWIYFDAMKHFTEVCSQPVKKHEDTDYNDNDNDDYEDDVKLFDLKQKLQVKPKVEVIEANQCRSCSNGEACVNLFEQDVEGLDLAYKLRIIGGIEVDRTENLPSQICLGCLQELENAYNFRRKCQDVDKELRNNQTQSNDIKLELTPLDDADNYHDADVEVENDFHDDNEDKAPKKKVKKESRRTIKKMNQRKQRYWQICEVCGKLSQNLASHMDVHAVDKAYSCEVCDKKFKFRNTLSIHRAVHDPNPTPKKTCEVCGKTFYILAQYRKHFVYHANERKYECATCGKRFNSPDILRVHNRIHTDERPFTCSDCGKTFRTAGCVGRHKRIVHKKIKVQNV